MANGPPGNCKRDCVNSRLCGPRWKIEVRAESDALCAVERRTYASCVEMGCVVRVK